MGSITSSTSRTRAAKNIVMFEAFCPLQVTGAPVISPCSLPKAIRLPVKVRKPRNTSSPSAAMVKRSIPPVAMRWWYSETPTRAAARPPKQCESAIRSGILVIGIQIDIAAPMAAPIIRPMAIHMKVRMSVKSSVPTTATSMPKAPIRLPRRAWVGDDSPCSARMKQTEATGRGAGRRSWPSHLRCRRPGAASSS